MPGEKTHALIEKRRQVVARGVGMFAGDTSVASASGAHLTDLDGRDLIDFAGGIGVMSAGHSHPDVVRAIQTQAEALQHACIHISTYEAYVSLCKKLTTLFPHGAKSKAMLVNSGAEAVENAIKIARQATRRPAVLCFDGAFHGRTLLGMTLTAKSAYKKNCGPFAPEVYRLPFPNRFRHGAGMSEAEFIDRELTRLKHRFVTGPVPADHIAAVIIEAIQGEGGFVVAPPAYLRGLRKICDEHGILLICDEVQSGFCRTGRWAAYQHAGIVPDIATWAKAMGGGLPIGAVTGRAEVMDGAEPGTIGGTFGGNPIACASSLATIGVMEKDKLCEQATRIGEQIRTRFNDLAERHNTVGEVRGLGAMMAVEFCYDRDPLFPATELCARAAARCREQGILVLTAGPFGNILRVLCPLTIGDKDLSRGLDVIDEAVSEATREFPA